MERVLVVDDNDSLRQTAKDALEEFGYQVDTATNPIDALFMAEDHPYFAIISDLEMPVEGARDNKDGVWLYHVLKVRGLSKRFILTTGVRDAVRAFFERTNQPAIEKPYKTAELLAAVMALGPVA